MVTCQDLMDLMEEIAPRHLAESWDNPGLLVGSPRARVARVLVCLDVSDAVIEQAAACGAQLIIAHHPLIFQPLKAIRTEEPAGRRIAALLAHGIAVFAAHTNLDIAAGGVNDVLAHLVGLSHLSAFEVTAQAEDGSAQSLGRVGTLPAPMSIEDFAAKVRAALPVPHLRYVDAGPRPVRKVALVSGSGAEFIDRAAALGVDAYLTGDVKYHEAQHAAELGLHLIDAGHFGTEFPIAAALAARLRALCAERRLAVEIVADEASHDIFQFL